MNNRDKNIVGQILAKTYRIERFLGVGTVGTVYVARHVRSGGLYAVKVLHRKLAASPDLYQRFQDEARLIATLRHPHILAITDFDRDENGIPFFVMDLLEGENLQQRLKHKESLPVAQSLEIVQQVGSALHTAHRSGIVHRNIKPENLFLVRHDLGDRVTETTKVMDFGLARFRRMAPAGTRDASLGVSPYMAPEMLQETTAPLDGRADQWALAVITYRMLTGKSPFDDDNPEEMLRQIVNDPPKAFPKMTPELPAHMAAAIHRGMAKRREDRYETMMDFVRALSSRPSTTEGDGVPQAQKPVNSGRVGAPMPPLPSGAVPPPLPPGAGPAAAPQGHPGGIIIPAGIPAGIPANTPAPSTANPPAGATRPSGAAPASTPVPSTVSPPQQPPPPDLKRPSLLISQEFKVPQLPPPRGPSMGLLVGGGILAVMAGVGLTLLWESRQRPRPLPPPITVPKDPGAGGKLVVEPLAPGGPDQPPAAQDAGPARPQYPPRPNVPPLRTLVDETTPAIPPTAIPATPGITPGTTPGAMPGTPPGTLPGTPPGTLPGANPAVRPPGTLPGATPGTLPGATPGMPGAPTNPAQVPPRPPVPGTPGQPTAMPPTATPPPAAPTPGPVKSRDEIDELIGGPNQAPPPTAPTPPVARPTPPPRPPIAPPATPAAPEGEKSSDAILQEAQAAYVSGERQKAIDMAMMVTRRPNPGDQLRAWRFIGSAACSVRSTTLATRAYNSLASPEHRQMLTELCKRNGLNFTDGQFIAE
jgi:serine/threonine protein kinase